MDPAEAVAVADLDWEDWSGEGNFVHHMLAGSIAGITEHTVMFPVDTIKTHIQCMRECPERQAGARVLEMVRGQGMLRLWRGVGTMFMGCVPAHAAYFSVLEASKSRFGANAGGHKPVAAAAAGGLATVFHDAFMTPMDVIKQRLQLGYYRGIGDCVRTIVRTEGARALYRSFPTTLFMNIPYGGDACCVPQQRGGALRQGLRREAGGPIAVQGARGRGSADSRCGGNARLLQGRCPALVGARAERCHLVDHVRNRQAVAPG
eukprot:TRINITY_DN2567_c0_g1_i3.p1 TRINITY_DN2567_c0_g1~~TRINITY_DN2567_c0_g1_i3.p1  ORF type:complete len:262 (-),score=60.70 TRINITY_DN2567_c0_g1_i3:475-1260(-)